MTEDVVTDIAKAYNSLLDSLAAVESKILSNIMNGQPVEEKHRKLAAILLSLGSAQLHSKLNDAIKLLI